MNALFGLKMSISISDRTVMGNATATAAFLACLPVPVPPKLQSATADLRTDPIHLQRAQKRLEVRMPLLQF